MSEMVKLEAKVPADLKEKVVNEAKCQCDGNVSMVVRRALRAYFNGNGKERQS